MILLMNTFLTWPMNHYQRGHLHRDDNFDIFKYTVSSLAAVNNWTHAIFNVRLDAHYQQHWDHLQDYIRMEFDPVCKRIDIRNLRCEHQSQWRDLVKDIEKMPDTYVWYCCNHDHVFMDYDHQSLNKALAALDLDPEPRKSIYYSHWPEFNRTIHNKYPEDFNMLPCGTIAGRWWVMDSIQIVSKPLLHSWWITPDYGNKYVPRSDWQDVYETEPYRVMVPSREVCKHFDGYSHLFDEKIVPPMTIPPGFFERNIKIRYGYDDNRDGWVNINPMRPYKTADPNGVDYRCTFLDIPKFWDGRITELDISPKYSHRELLDARNQAYREYMTCHTNHHVMGDKMPPEEYIQKSMRGYS